MELREKFANTDWRWIAKLEECERGHEFVKLPDHPLNSLGHAICVYCTAQFHSTSPIPSQEGR